MASEKNKARFLKRWKLKKRKSEEVCLQTNNDKKKQFNNFEVLSLVIITAAIGIFLGFNIIKKDEDLKYSESLIKFINDYNNIVDNYYDEIDEDDVLKKALETVIEELDDPYTSVVDDSLSNALSTQLQGSYSGFGIEIYNDKSNNIVISGIIADSPASKSDLKPGDIITKMDDINVEGMKTSEFTDNVKKSNKQKMILSVKRNNELLNISIQREIITLQSVASKMIENNEKKIGYIYISLFAANTDVQFKKALKELEDKKIDSLIIDLRDNTGGHLTATENITSEFLDKTHVIYQLKTKDEITKIYSSGSKTKKYNISVLVNKNSASGSELLTAALKEEYKAIVVGETTFGKGTVQQVQNSLNTNIEYKMTTKKWLTPKGNWIHKKGIKPDIEIKLDKEFYNNPTDKNDNQLQKAIETLTK